MMVRYVFDSVKDFVDWVKDNVTKERYKAFVTVDNEIVLVPKRSTKPLEYAYLQFDSAEKQEVLECLTSLGLKVYSVKAVEWADDRAVGVKFAVE